MIADFIGVFSTISAPFGNRETDIENDSNYVKKNKKLLKIIPVGRSPVGIAVSSDKRPIYVVSSVSSVKQTLYIIDSRKNEVMEEIPDLRENPEEIASTPEQKRACIIHRSLVPDQNSQMTIVHLEKQSVYTCTNWKKELQKKLQREEGEILEKRVQKGICRDRERFTSPCGTETVENTPIKFDSSKLSDVQRIYALPPFFFMK
jgi:hypothetical protein